MRDPNKTLGGSIMAGKNVGNPTNAATGKKTEYKFRYNPARDRCGIAIGSVIAAIVFVVLCIISNVAGFPRAGITIGSIIYIVCVLLVVVINLFSIYKKTFSVMTIKKEEIVFCSGWLTKGTTTIPAHKIRSCTKCSTWLQRQCKTMDIAITTAGDGAEIHFCNIEAGERAYKLIAQMAKENGRER